ncbi:MAG: hypothetical protein KAG10_08935, partial [Methylococcales bacterium]|nr:hypothetical protein [Methylococcales bacterium]
NTAAINVNMPVGIGFKANGIEGRQPLSIFSNNLQTHIKTVFTDNGDAFIDSTIQLLDPLKNGNYSFFEQKIIVSTNSDSNPSPKTLVIDGTPELNQTTSPVLNTLVIDTTVLPNNSGLELNNIIFTAIKGNVTVKGDENTNILFLDNLQTQQTAFGKGGDDLFQVAKGEYLLHGGKGNDLVRFEGNESDYKITQTLSKVIVTSVENPIDTVTLINVEQLQFKDSAITIDYNPVINGVVGSYIQAIGRQPDFKAIQNLANAVISKNLSVGKSALLLMTSEELSQKIGFDITQAATPTQVDQLYLTFLKRLPNEDNKNAWIKKLSEGSLSLEGFASHVVTSPEMQGHYAAPTEWDFSL